MTPSNAEQRTEHLATIEQPFHFVDSGLPNVYLAGIRYFTYPDGRIAADIPAVKQLMRLIARDLIQQQEPLTGDEIRFLRKRLGQRQNELAQAIGIQPETLSRCENGHQDLGESTDKFIRYYYALSALDDMELAASRHALREMLAEWHDEQPSSGRKPVVAQVINDRWILRAA